MYIIYKFILGFSINHRDTNVNLLSFPSDVVRAYVRIIFSKNNQDFREYEWNIHYFLWTIKKVLPETNVYYATFLGLLGHWDL